jgi:hypothetical protein
LKAFASAHNGARLEVRVLMPLLTPARRRRINERLRAEFIAEPRLNGSSGPGG